MTGLRVPGVLQVLQAWRYQTLVRSISTLGLSGTHVLVTGGYGMIGKIVVQAFLAAGGHVTVLDINDRSPFDVEDDEKMFYVNTDIANAEQVEAAFNSAEARFGPVLICVALASLDLSVLSQCESLADMEPTTWQRVFDVNINGTFNTCRSWLRYGLLHSLAQDAPRIYAKARVNAVAPGNVDTELYKRQTAENNKEWYWTDNQATVPQARAVPPEDVARTILFLASERYSGSVHGQLLPIDGGKTGNLAWTMDELERRRIP